jgi:hypothetical protein
MNDRVMTEATKICEQCQHSKPLSAFHRRKNKTDGRMRICAECYMLNYREQQRTMAEALERWNREREEREKEREAQRHAWEEVHQRTLGAWYQQQPDRQCITCKQLLPASDFGYSLVVATDDGIGWVPKVLHKRCKSCHEEYRKNNRRIYPLCQLCSTPKPL